MKKFDSILWMAGSDWWVHNTYSEKRYARIYASEGTRVLFVNSISIGVPSITSANVLKRIFRKFISLFRALRQVEQNLFVFTPLLIPVWNVRPVEMFNIFILHHQLRLAMRIAGLKNPAGVYAIPTAAVLLGRLGIRGVVYYVKDKYSSYHESMSFSKAGEHDRQMLEGADVIACASRGLYNEYAEEYPEVRWVPHGASTLFFEYTDKSEPPEIRGIPHPRITYWGLLDIQIDEDLLEAVALARPDWHILLAGPRTHDFKSLRSLANVHFLPPASQEFLIRLGLHSDVLMNCRKDSDWNRYACPTKLREYLALGKPVVSVPIIEMEETFPNAARIALGAEEWIAAIEDALAEDGSEQTAFRKSLVEGYDVRQAASQFESVISHAVRVSNSPMP